jgi:nucleoside-diphosphate-sugar epimerase
MRFDLVANLFTIKALKEGTMDVFGGEQYRPFIHCNDAARAFLSAIEFGCADTDRENFNIVGENISIKELGSLVGDIVEDAKVNWVQQKEDNRNYKVSGEKAAWIMNYMPRFGLQRGIEGMITSLKYIGYKDWKDNPIYYNHLCGKEIKK